MVNYGGDPRVAPFMELSDADWDESISMFISASVTLSRDFARLNWGGRGGSIVYVTSMTVKQALEASPYRHPSGQPWWPSQRYNRLSSHAGGHKG
ncbi:SDR family NAD(P)-dependent oxidoreductase [Thermogymnomonas acidicola]|uniref:SDR family NAD(P)-dependent oxidoreductase n=1 Tax=Thermogymnomonas acidicola TaxID=399579 RepID=UPI001396A603|nr:SDR family NAD(P)-dependent oxidoreductase [Thermogymnomonas acidicola]